MTKKRKNFKKSTTPRLYRPLTGIARKAGIPKYQMEAALIEGIGKLCGFVWDLGTLQQFDQSLQSTYMLENLEQWLKDNQELLAPVVNEILQRRLQQPIKNWGEFKMSWEHCFSSFPIELQPTYTVALQSKPEPPVDTDDIDALPW